MEALPGIDIVVCVASPCIQQSGPNKYSFDAPMHRCQIELVGLILNSGIVAAKAEVFSCMVSLHASTSPNCIQLQWPPAGHCSDLFATTVKLSVQPSWRTQLVSKIGRPLRLLRATVSICEIVQGHKQGA